VDARGFTLIELIVVLAVMSLLIASVPIVMSGGLAGLELKAAARDVADTLRHARGRAIALNDEITFSVDDRSGRYGLGQSGRQRVLGKGMEVTVRPESMAGTIRFYPDGGSTGGRITISRNERRYDVRVDWLTGQVTIED
jgi:general secretion pathway protein H